ncbi:unnamed protein product [Angiostrongylus costaricensis]|uniref:RMI1_N domain-containing protein n=1 Tax=Angiostrongylus costaricensis TaxID=334426 RepID=A0A0R3PV58_ANGCS|nr:unnamed protein product [Angiostrongylus costaricensis]
MIRLRMNKKKTQFMTNPWREGEQIQLDGSLSTEITSYVCVGNSMIVENGKQKLKGGWKAVGIKLGPIKEAIEQDRLKNQRSPFDSIPALSSTVDAWTDSSVTHYANSPSTMSSQI